MSEKSVVDETFIEAGDTDRSAFVVPIVVARDLEAENTRLRAKLGAGELAQQTGDSKMFNDARAAMPGYIERQLRETALRDALEEITTAHERLLALITAVPAPRSTPGEITEEITEVSKLLLAYYDRPHGWGTVVSRKCRELLARTGEQK